MKKTNYHTHTVLSDGFNSAKEITEAAIKNNFKILGFSEHSPVFFPSEWNMKLENLNEYIHQIDEVKNEFKNNIEIICGMEVDFFKNRNYISFWKNFGIDYAIGSVHYLPVYFDYNTPFNIDKSQKIFEKALKNLFNDNIKSLVNLYYEQISDMLENDTPDIVAHLEQVAKFNKDNLYFNTNDNWYNTIIKQVLEIIKNKNTVLEINCRSKYRKISDDYSPSLKTIKTAAEKNIPMTISGDIHHYTEFSYFWDDAVKDLKDAGVNELYYLDSHGWHSQAIN